MSLVFFDLESTGCALKVDEILEIGAVGPNEGGDGELTFKRYVRPVRKTKFPEATNVNNLSMQGKQLCHQGKPVPEDEIADSLFCALDDFLNWLNRNYRFQVVLVAHNGTAFDFPMLKRDVEENSRYFRYADYSRLGFFDSLPLLRGVKGELGLTEGCSLPKLSEHFFGEAAKANHRAVDDSKLLKKVCEAAGRKLGKNTLAEFFAAGKVFGWDVAPASGR